MRIRPILRPGLRPFLRPILQGVQNGGPEADSKTTAVRVAGEAVLGVAVLRWMGTRARVVPRADMFESEWAPDHFFTHTSSTADRHNTQGSCRRGGQVDAG